MIEIRQVSLRYGPQIVFDSINTVLPKRARVGLVGRNGAGKTTFLKMLLGQAELDGGEIVCARGTTFGYLPQDGLETEGRPLVEEVESAEVEIGSLLGDLEKRQAELKAYPGSHDEAEYQSLLEEIGELERKLEHREAHLLRPRAEKVLCGLGFQVSDFGRDCGEFSGGWQMRIALAKLLLRSPHFLLLDEPTNHLDLPSQRWLEQYLTRYEGGFVLISHDRAFLDLLTTHTYALSRGKLEVYAGNYSFFERESAKRKEVLRAQKESQDRQIEKTQQFIDRFRYKASKASQVQSRIKSLGKLDRVEIEEEEAKVRFSFPPAPRSGQLVLELKGVHKAYGSLKLFEDFDLKLERGQRLAVVGVNGAGKSTLAKMIAGEERLDSGLREEGLNARIAYFAQHQAETLNPAYSALEAALDDTPATEQQARDILGAFLFRGDAVFKKVSVLSGGERNRLALARMLLRPANLLILDEPTNHLDIQSKGVLQDAMRRFDGGFLIVSHDRDFVDPLVDRVLEVSPRGHRMFWGNVTEYLQKVEAEGESAASAGNNNRSNGSGSALNAKERRRMEAERRQALAPLRKEVERVEAEIGRYEAEIADWEEKMKDPGFFGARESLKEDLQAYETAKRMLEHAMEEWEKAHEALEAVERNGW